MSPKSNYLKFLKLNKKKLNTPDIIVVVAFYKFFEVRDTVALQNSLKSIFNDTEIKGTILIAKEGVNGTIAGKINEIKIALEKLWSLDFFIDLEPKYSFAFKNPFFRMKIRLKKEIVTILKLTYPISALNPAASIPKTAAISSLSDVSPDIPKDPIILSFLSLIKTPPGTGTSSPFESALTALMK